MPSTLLAVPNVSEGRDGATIAAISDAFVAAGARLLNVHSDADHHRTVYTLAGPPGSLAHALLAGFEIATESIDIRDGRGQHPHIGAIDVAPIVHVDNARRGAACAEALLLADLIGQHLRVPVLMYGALAAGRTRSELRRGGVAALTARLQSGRLRPDFGPSQPHPRAGATLVAGRPPLVAFNLELEPPATVEQARAVAARVREGGEEGLAGVRAIGVGLRRTRSAGADDRYASAASSEGMNVAEDSTTGAEDSVNVAQVSLNVERPEELPLRTVVARVKRAAHAVGAEVLAAELVGLLPAGALEGYPEHTPIRDFDPTRDVIENVLD